MRFAAAAASATLSLLAWHARALDEQCKDPLFETHWFGKAGFATRGDAGFATVSSIPIVKTGLTLCPQYNGKMSCCSNAFEAEQLRHFGYFRNMIFPLKFHNLKEHRQSVQDVQNTAAWTVATAVEREQFNLALERFNPVLHPSVHAGCFSALLTYTAGMNCFACKPDWFGYVVQDSGQVIRLDVHPSVCMELWARCEAFGAAATQLRQALLDSALAKQAKRPSEDLDMFVSQQALCDWLHQEVALHPFQRPSEAEREAAPEDMTPPVAASTTLSPAAAAARAEAKSLLRTQQAAAGEASSQRLRRLQGDSLGQLDILAEGRASGFDTVWPGSGSSGASALAGSRCSLAALALAGLTAAVGLGGGA